METEKEALIRAEGGSPPQPQRRFCPAARGQSRPHCRVFRAAVMAIGTLALVHGGLRLYAATTMPVSPTAAAPAAAYGSLSDSPCLTPACIHAASDLLDNLSPNYKELDPCTDFEELVCGGW
jgi:endothelin-converting enzyme